MSLQQLHGHSTRQNYINAAVLVTSTVPPIAMYVYYLQRCQHWSAADIACDIGAHQPLTFLNILMLVNMDLLLWVLSLVQDSTWLIDPYWTLVPLMIAHYYSNHPTATTNATRSTLSFTLLYIWAARLTHNYFRREEWNVGVREDWRFTMMRKRLEPIVGTTVWKMLTLPLTYLSQHPILFGLTLPYYAIQQSQAPLSLMDVIATIIAISGLVIAYFADTQLRSFILANEQRQAQGQAKVFVLETGLWRYSRHPNYLGEITWWTGVGLFSISTGRPQYLIGTLCNTVLLLIVSVMVEDRMMADQKRRAAYEQYRQRVGMLIPWRSHPQAHKEL